METEMIESLKKNGKGIILMLISALSLSVGQLLWKFAISDGVGSSLDSPDSIFRLAVAVLPGFIVYAIGAVVMTVALGMGELSVLQPMNCMSYVFALILSAIFLSDEAISPVTVAGVFVIIIGVVLIGGSSK